MTDIATGPRPSPGKEFGLVPHQDHPSRGSFIVKAGAMRRVDGRYLVLTFRVYGDVARIAWHDRAVEGRTDALWKNSCFEACIGSGLSKEYVELNLAPARSWALYTFAGYRAGMRDADDATVARMDFFKRDLSVPRVEMQVLIEMPERFVGSDWLLGLTAIIEELDGTKSYWALAHAPGPPDFHNRDCFKAKLPAPKKT